MSHPEQLGFLSLIARNFRDVVDGGSVLEIGSYDVNGSVRSVFSAAKNYTGVDLVEGPGVDLVCYGHEIPFDADSFDLVVSAECLEHDPLWIKTFLKMWEVVRPNGVVALTCASRGRPEHGTSRTLVEDSPGTQNRGSDYYRNLNQSDFESQIQLANLFASWRFFYLPTHFDLYFVGIKGDAGNCREADPRLPGEGEVRALADLMSLPHRLARFPLRLLSRLPEEPYQVFAARYWFWLDRLLKGRFRRATRTM